MKKSLQLDLQVCIEKCHLEIGCIRIGHPRKNAYEAWGDCKPGCPGYVGKENIFLIIL